MRLDGIKLIIFDLDGTLADRESDQLYPHVKAFFTENATKYQFAVATNQGGVGLRCWMMADGFGEPDKYPSRDDIENRIYNIDQRELPHDCILAWYVCYAYQSKKSGKWAPSPIGSELESMWQPSWRKPAPGMLEAAMKDALVYPQETLMVGDSDEDRLAAEAAHCDFQWADNFFERVSG